MLGPRILGCAHNLPGACDKGRCPLDRELADAALLQPRGYFLTLDSKLARDAVHMISVRETNSHGASCSDPCAWCKVHHVSSILPAKKSKLPGLKAQVVPSSMPSSSWRDFLVAGLCCNSEPTLGWMWLDRVREECS